MRIYVYVSWFWNGKCISRGDLVWEIWKLPSRGEFENSVPSGTGKTNERGQGMNWNEGDKGENDLQHIALSTAVSPTPARICPVTKYFGLSKNGRNGILCKISFYLFIFCEEDWPWANICCQSSSFCLRKIVPELTSVPISLYFVYGMPPQHGLMSGVEVCAQDPTQEPRDAEVECANLTTTPLGWPPPLVCLI